MIFAPNKEKKGFMADYPKSKIPDGFDPDTVSKRTLVNMYQQIEEENARLRKAITAISVRLFFYAPNDDYFAPFSDEERDKLTLKAAEMFGGGE